MKIAIASDHAGFELKETIKAAFADRIEWLDVGTCSLDSTSYATHGHALARLIAAGDPELGIAICGSGIGISITLNRHKGVRAALCTDVTMARLSRVHNDANVLVMGSRIIGRDIALDCVQAFISTPHEGGRHTVRIQEIEATY